MKIDALNLELMFDAHSKIDPKKHLQVLWAVKIAKLKL